MEIHNKINEKIEKLAAAAYLVTDHLSDREGIKYDLRSHGVTLVTLVGTYTKVSPFDRDVLFTDIEMTIGHILSLMRVLETAKIIREDNLGILMSEYQKFFDTLKNYHNQFQITETDTRLQSVIGEPLTFQVEIPQKQSMTSALKEVPKPTQLVHSFQHNQAVKTPSSLFKKEVNNGTHLSDKKDSRQKQILDIIRDKKEVSIKDIALLIKDCSEKTIQRELTALVEEAKIVRTGDKRWSKYSLK